MAIVITTGYPGHGKTTALAVIAKERLIYAEKIYKKYGNIRKHFTNIKYSQEIEKRFKQFINYYHDIEDIENWRDCDIIMDEITLYFDSHNWEKLPRNVKKYLKLHRHYGVNIYGATQDFMTVDITVRRLTTKLINSIKIISTREPDPHLPPLKYPFSFNLVGEVLKSHRELEKEHYEYENKTWTIYTKKHFNIFDTRQDIEDIPLPPIIKNNRTIIYRGGQLDGRKEQKYI